jgi:hypothetical protein
MLIKFDMKRALLFLFMAVAGLADQKPRISDCFKVHSLTRTDNDHYWASWTNACPYIIDSVYVMIEFSDQFHKQLGNGVWGLHFITQGMHRVTRFSTPLGVSDFQFVNIRKVTADSDEALR